MESRGAWWSAAEGATRREGTKLVIRLHDGSPEQEARIQEIVSHYKTRFRQESVLRWDSPACVWF